LGTPESGPEAAHSGENVFGTDLDGSYAPGALLSLRSPVIDLEGQGRPRLRFWYFIDATEGAEGGRLKVHLVYRLVTESTKRGPAHNLSPKLLATVLRKSQAPILPICVWLPVSSRFLIISARTPTGL
jgi:hypothetical protein